jgi:DNA polymerase (family X)
MKQAKLFGGEDPKVIEELPIEATEEPTLAICKIVTPLCEKVEVVGSIRRKRKVIHDIDLTVVCTDTNWKRIQHSFKNHICIGDLVFKFNYPLNNQELFQCDIYRATEKNFGIMNLVRTGSGDHNAWLASYARSKGMMLKYSEGLVKDDVVLAGETEQGIFEALGLPCPEPKDREIVNGKPIWQN